MKFDPLKTFKDKKIIVIGDMMIDRYVYGASTHISPEAPVPVVKIMHEKDFPGGAANVANNLAILGAKVYIAGIIGKDRDGAILKKLFQEKKMDISMLMEDVMRPTTVKKRIISGNNYQLLRLDYETTAPLNTEFEKKITKRIVEKIPEIDAIVFSDYAKGLINQSFVRNIISNAKNKPVIVDTKPAHIKYFKGCTLITPNLKEAIEMSGEPREILKMGKTLVKMLNTNVFITRGPEGISVFDKRVNHTHVPTMHITRVFDVTGAGDTVVSIAALSMACGFSLTDVATLANYAAGIVVQKPGTSFVSPDEFNEVFQLISKNKKPGKSSKNGKK